MAHVLKQKTKSQRGKAAINGSGQSVKIQLSRRVALTRATQAAIRRVLCDEYLHGMLCDEIIARDHLANDVVSDLVRTLSCSESERRLRLFQKLKGTPVSTELKDGDVRVRYCQIIKWLRAMGSKLTCAPEMIPEIESEIQKYLHAFDRGEMVGGIKIRGVRFRIELTVLLVIESARDPKALKKLLSRVFKRWTIIEDVHKSTSYLRFRAHEAAAELGHDRLQGLKYLKQTGCFGGENTSVNVQDARLAQIGQFHSRDVRNARGLVARALADYLEQTRSVERNAALRLVLQTIEGKPISFPRRPKRLLTEDGVLHDFVRFEAESRRTRAQSRRA
jgi:hypothetical protein